MLGLYIHIPFCGSICSYCNFNRGLFDAGLKTRYVDALAREIEAWTPETDEADTIFFGGGTPSLLDPAEIARLIRVCRSRVRLTDDAEITLETNPETASVERLAGFLDAGVNRISFGVQSFDDQELQRLGRAHSAARAKQAIRDARSAGFRNLSFDLMFWLPGQTRASWRQTVDDAVALAPDHLSLYLLELYPNAPLKEAMARIGPDGASAGQARVGPDGPSAPHSHLWAQASDDEAADMYLEALERLDAAGFEQYEISNVSRPDCRSRHNVKYWQGEQWRGFGCGAHSTAGGRRWKNVAATGDYCDRIDRGAAIAIDVRELGAGERVEEALFTGLRMNDGIGDRNFLDRYGVDPWSRYQESLQPYVAEGLMWRRPGGFGLTRRGMLVANDIFTNFV